MSSSTRTKHEAETEQRTWRIDDIDVVVTRDGRVDLLPQWPIAVCRGALNCDPFFPLELHAVHLGTDLVLAADFVDGLDATGVEEDALGEGRLATVDVGRDTDVALLR
jgi:hypothetical protein